jgi:hypothetical protein
MIGQPRRNAFSRVSFLLPDAIVSAHFAHVIVAARFPVYNRKQRRDVGGVRRRTADPGRRG